MAESLFHPRNRHSGRYDFKKLVAACPALGAFVAPTKYGDDSIDFSDPAAVRTLNRALLALYYGLRFWEIPENYLCPPIPGRADLIHNAADLLAGANGDVVPRGAGVRVLDVGVGASCIYPLIGNREYGWSFVGTEVDPVALASAQRNAEKNPELGDAIQFRRQGSRDHLFKGVITPGEEFDLTVCNPPFHASLAEAEAGTRRKWENLGKGKAAHAGKPRLNFGGQHSELWCPGGEVAFISKMIQESRAFGRQVFCFSALVSKQESLPVLDDRLADAGVADRLVLDMSQGQKKSRLLAWTFLDDAQREAWRLRRWA